MRSNIYVGLSGVYFVSNSLLLSAIHLEIKFRCFFCVRPSDFIFSLFTFEQSQRKNVCILVIIHTLRDKYVSAVSLLSHIRCNYKNIKWLNILLGKHCLYQVNKANTENLELFSKRSHVSKISLGQLDIQTHGGFTTDNWKKLLLEYFVLIRDWFFENTLVWCFTAVDYTRRMHISG